MWKFYVLMCSVVVAGCGGNVGSTVLQDFGLQERSEDYVSGRDRTMESMRMVGAAEVKRLNAAGRHGELVYDDSEALRGKYFKRVKKYMRAYALEAQPVSRSGNRKETGFTGLIEYSYEFYEGRRASNRTEAQAADAEIPTGERGRDTFRYRFSSGGVWNGGKGVPVK
ncbi:MAG: hypothetical protein VCD00_12360 [Candidatus Hydrogenedentota bacterium]